MRKESTSIDGDLVLFFVLAFSFSWLCWIPAMLHSNKLLVLPELLSAVLGYLGLLGPAIAAFILTGIRQGKAGVWQLWQRGWNWRFPKMWLLPLLLLMPAVGGMTMLVLVVLSQSLAWQYGVPFLLIIPIFFLMFMSALPEEYGWRGFALDRLQHRWSAIISSLILGVLWGLWHLPLHFTNGTTQAVIPVWEYVLQTIVLTVLYTWLYNNTGRSVLAATLFHAMGNITGAVIPFWTTEAGRWVNFILLFIIVAIVIWVWRPRRLVHGE